MSKEITKEEKRDAKNDGKKDKKDKGKLKIKSLLKGDLVDFFDANPELAVLGAILEELQKAK